MRIFEVFDIAIVSYYAKTPKRFLLSEPGAVATGFFLLATGTQSLPLPVLTLKRLCIKNPVKFAIFRPYGKERLDPHL